MKHATVLLLLTLTVSLSAIVNIYDEYIGPGPMGQYRKTFERHMGGDTDTIEHFFYDGAHPDRLSWRDKLYHYPMGEEYSKAFYEYQEFDDHRKVIENEYFGPYNYSGPPTPSIEGFDHLYVRTSTYDLQGKILEFSELNIPINYTKRTLYEYNSSGNLISETSYCDTSSTPYIVVTYGYDGQNRLNYYKYVINGRKTDERWQTWSNYSLPDSIHTIRHDNRTLIQKNHFDENGMRYYWQQWEERSAPYYWYRTDATYEYTFAHQICFPTSILHQAGFVNSVDADFEPSSTATETFTYTEDYHRVSVSRGTYSANCTFDANWFLTSSYRGDHGGSDSWAGTSTYGWEYYTSNDDPVAVPPALVSAYPNPAKGMVNISLSKSDVRKPVEAKIYNIKGQLVRSLEVGNLSSDQYLYNWDCKDQRNNAVPAGIYLIRIKTERGEVSKKVTVLK
jgi:hypothetical protein